MAGTDGKARLRRARIRRIILDRLDEATAAGLSLDGQGAMLRLAANPLSEVDAIVAINAYLDGGLPLPPIFYPWLRKAMSAAASQPGNKQRLRAKATEEKKRKAVWMVVGEWSFGGTKDDAIEWVASMTGYSADTLKQYCKDNREWVDEAWRLAAAHPVVTFTVPDGVLGAGVTFTRRCVRTRHDE
ncbi:hypothetical protein [Thiocapsa sp. UBA6158]|jgi:hypothetical protein|uniref:hypothetical protein n=1 Tax=Thiocapsa sp. UBA6158 TaxID=1947692 RepID=UPI0025D83782|nr:hypothetical protein [Thiocapsa sp. UBA6158]